MPIALGIAGIVGGVTSLIGAHDQSSAANNAADLQAQQAQQSLDFQRQQYNTQQQQEAPYIQAGTQALGELNGGQLPAFQAPTGATEQNDPGYQFRLQQGKAALDNSAAAKGGVLGGNEATALEQYGQNYASNEYSNVYNRAMNNYNTNVLGPYNRLSALAGIGQQALGTSGQQGQTAANNITNINSTAGSQIGANINNAGAATASGYVGAGNAISNGLTQSVLLNSLLGSSQQNQNSQYPNIYGGAE